MPPKVLLIFCVAGALLCQRTDVLSPEEVILRGWNFPVSKFSGSHQQKVQKIKQTLIDENQRKDWGLFLIALGLLGDKDDSDFLIERVDTIAVKGRCNDDSSGVVAAAIFSLGFLANKTRDRATFVYLEHLIKDSRDSRTCTEPTGVEAQDIQQAALIALGFSASIEGDDILASIRKNRKVPKSTREMAGEAFELSKEVRTLGLLKYISRGR